MEVLGNIDHHLDKLLPHQLSNQTCNALLHNRETSGYFMLAPLGLGGYNMIGKAPLLLKLAAEGLLRHKLTVKNVKEVGWTIDQI
ncbi:hypothetical protein H5410_037464 [Solanum commersonii]|uniref:Uncharacterized protein n=1 Tax=Solanum commersonii TaxID=4109 RepID=A0A9J5Y9L8_SOLCO|nr:hypothetical protein H5410_037464 [Solanum commersonii]